jgi:4,5-DOPA dioxygenase extradiol
MLAFSGSFSYARLMSAFRFPSLFISHGTPMSAFGEDPYQSALSSLSNSLPRPKAILVLSAHSISNSRIHVLKTARNRIQHDFTGFPRELYELEYSCPGSPELADQISRLLANSGLEVKVETDAPLDHGIWVPLLHMYPECDIPVVRVSLPLNLLPAQILKMGHALSSLREQGVLMIASGGAVHNLSELQWSGKNTPGAEWALQFEQWLIQSLRNKDVEALMNFEEHPLFRRAHPSSEHFLPVLFAVGSALPGDEFSEVFRGIQYESLSMLCFSLNSPPEKPATILH